MSVTYKLMVLGEGGSGKTSLIYRFLNPAVFAVQLEPSIEDIYTKLERIDGESCNIVMYEIANNMWDADTGREDFAREADAFVLVFGVDSRSSYDAIPDYINYIRQKGPPHTVPLLILANKTDLSNTPDRVIRGREVDQLLTTHQCRALEVSAKDGYIDEAFFTAVRLAREAKEAREARRRKRGCVIQ